MHNSRNYGYWTVTLALFVAGYLGSVPASAQVTTGAISGLVTDQTSGTVPEAAVTVKNVDTNLARTTTTGNDGRFRISALPVGQYEVTIDAKGFAKYVRSPVLLTLNQEAVLDTVLRPATVQETIVVTEAVALIDTSNAEVGVRFDSFRMQELPISGKFGTGGGFRDAFAVVLSAPGVSQTNTGNSKFANGTDYSANGMRTRANNYMVDGQDVNEPGVAGRSQWMNNPDTIQEIHLITNQFLPEYGRGAGSIVNAITKSGTNSLHGSAFEYYNGNHLNARSNLEKAAGFIDAPFFIEHQFGGTAGGPVVRDKTFLFGSIQRWTQRQLGAGRTIVGVLTAAGKQTLQSLAGSRPQVAALLKFLPAAQTSTGQSVPLTVGGQTVQIPTGSLTNSTSQFQNNWQWSGRVDHQLTTKNSIGGRYLFNDNVQG